MKRRREQGQIVRFLLHGGRGTFIVPQAELPPDFILPSAAPIPENPEAKWMEGTKVKRLSALLLFLSLFTLTAWTYDDCVEVDFDHPDCDRYTTTTTEVPPSSTSSTSATTTSTSGSQNSTTTSTLEGFTTTTTESPNVPIPTTTTTVQECPPGTIHQPPLCVPTTIPFFDTTTVPDTTSVISPPAELPRTGVADLPLLALSLVGLSVLGFTALKYGRNEE